MSRLHTLATGPAPELRPASWVAPTINEEHESANWGGGERGLPNTRLLAEGTDLLPEPLIEIDGFLYTVGAAELLLDYVASAVAAAKALESRE